MSQNTKEETSDHDESSNGKDKDNKDDGSHMESIMKKAGDEI